LKKFVFALLVLVSLAIKPVYAEIGCLVEYHSPNEGRIYTTALGDVQFYSSKYKEYNRAGSITIKSYSNSISCGETSPSSVSPYSESGYNGCWVNTYLNATNNQDNVQYGNWVQFTIVAQCPIDSDLIYFLIMSAGAGWFLIKYKISA